MSIGLAKNNLLKGKASIRFNARDPFGWQRFEAVTQYGGTVDLALNNRWDNRSFGASLTYRLVNPREDSLAEEHLQRKKNSKV